MCIDEFTPFNKSSTPHSFPIAADFELMRSGADGGVPLSFFCPSALYSYLIVTTFFN
jgi:hypothetical protein